MSLQHIMTPAAGAGNPAVYSQAVVVGNMVFTAGAIGLDPTTVTPFTPPPHPFLPHLTAHHRSPLTVSSPRSPAMQGKFNSDNVEGQTRQTLANLTHVLTAAGASLSTVAKVTVFLVDMGNFSSVNAIYSQHFPSPKPARTCIAVSALPLGALIEIEATAFLAPK